MIVRPDFVRIFAIDLSLSATGIAYGDTITERVTDVLSPPNGMRGPARLDWISNGLLTRIADYRPHLVVVEGPLIVRLTESDKSLLMLHGVLQRDLWLDRKEMVYVHPSTLKSWALAATGKKIQMVIAARDRLGYAATDDNEADACWLHAAGMEAAGQPLVPMPANHVAKLATVEWPEWLDAPWSLPLKKARRKAA